MWRGKTRLGVGVGIGQKGTLLNQNNNNADVIISALLNGGIGGQNGLVFNPSLNVFSDTTNEYKQFIANLTLINN